MESEVLNRLKAGYTGLEFTGNRQPVRPMPNPLEIYVRSWCDLNKVFMSDDGAYIVFSDSSRGKKELIKLYLEYYTSNRTGNKFVIARNHNFHRRINVTNLMALEHEIQTMDFDEDVMRMFGSEMDNTILE